MSAQPLVNARAGRRQGAGRPKRKPTDTTVRAALAAIPANIEREKWVRVAMALKSFCGDAGNELFDIWSQQADSYDPCDAHAVWRGVQEGGRTTVGTLLGIAKSYGFDLAAQYSREEADERSSGGRAPVAEPVALAAVLAARKDRDDAEQAEREAERARAAVAARWRWERAQPAGAGHPYLVRKGVATHGCRMDAGVLLVPMMDADGVQWSIQAIGADGAKRFPAKARTKGLHYWIGDPSSASTLMIAEGFATAATLHEATGLPVVVAFNAGNLADVATALRRRFPDARWIVAADDDRTTEQRTGRNPGVDAARIAAAVLGAVVALPNFGPNRSDNMTDFNDMATALGAEAVCNTIKTAINGPGGMSSRTSEHADLIAQALAATEAGDAGAIFAPEVVEALREMKALSLGEYMTLRGRIKEVKPKVLISELDRAVIGETSRAGDASIADRLVALARQNCEFFHDEERVAYALVTRGGHRECWRIDCDGFREWLSFAFYQGEGVAPAEAPLATACATLSGQAKFEGPERPVAVRVARVDDAYYLDLCNDAWQVVEITARGWRVIDAAPVMFTRSSSMRPLPMPGPGGDVDALWALVNVPEPDRELVLAWLIECLRPDTPFVVLELVGEQGSAKSTTQRLLRSLFDPNHAPLRAAPKNVEDVFVQARNAGCVSFENISYLPATYQDALCVLATGGGFSARKLYTNADETVLNLKRPVMLNGISVIVTAQDLVDRTLHIDLPEIERRRTATDVEARFEAQRSAILGGLLDLMVRTLALLPGIRIEPARLPRMADFALLGEAVFQASGRPEGEFLAMFNRKRTEGVHRTLDAAPVAVAARAWLADNPSGFEGTVKGLFEKLTRHRPEGEAWPKSAKGFGDALRRVAPGLRLIGVNARIADRRGMHGYTCTLMQVSIPFSNSDPHDSSSSSSSSSCSSPRGHERHEHHERHPGVSTPEEACRPPASPTVEEF